MFNPYIVEAVGREQQRDLERALSHKVRIAEARRGQRAQERMTGVKGGSIMRSTSFVARTRRVIAGWSWSRQASGSSRQRWMPAPPS